MCKKISLMLSIALAVSLLSACGNASDSGADSGKKTSVDLTEPVTLMFKSFFGDSADLFNQLYGDRIRKKFPNVTINFIPRDSGTGLADLVAAGQYPDIVYGNTSDIDSSLIDLGLAYDMTELIKKDNYDLNRFQPELLDAMRNTNPDGALYGLPMPYTNEFVLFYNKDIFDKFGVAYPKDGMTWDDAYELAKRMTRVDGDQVYRGFSSFIGALLRDNQLSVPYLDPKADKMYDPEAWKKLLSNLARFYEIPNNNRDPKKRSQTEEYQYFHVKKNVAMQANQFTRYLEFPSDLNWDMTTLPVFKEAPNTGTMASSYYWFITPTNKHKELSFEIIKYMLSDEVQLDFARKLAYVPSIKNSNNMFSEIGKEVPLLKGKNIAAIYKLKPAPALPKRDRGLVGANPNELKKIMEQTFDKITLDNVDMNTALREAQEAMAKQVEAKKSQ